MSSSLVSFQLYNKRAKVGIIHYRLKDILLFFLNERDYVPKNKQQVLQPNTKEYERADEISGYGNQAAFPRLNNLVNADRH